MIRHSVTTSESWKDLPWKKFRKSLFRLQLRVFKAVKAGDKRRACQLQKLILKSRAARFLAIRQVSQLNSGKKTAGIDGKVALAPNERFKLEEILATKSENWYHQGLREIPIPKKNGKTRMLKIPTIADRAWQCMAKYALEPAHEATFHANSYGFRPGRGAHDAQEHLFVRLTSTAKGYEKRILEIDIEKCFDTINHTAIMERLIAPKGLKQGIYRCLKAGTNPGFPHQGTPQGGVVSPLLANIALNGIEDCSMARVVPDERRTTSQIIRYADDMVVVIKAKKADDEVSTLEKINNFLAERGMKINQAKTRTVHSTDGFDFLGWNFRVKKNRKIEITPSKENISAFKKKAKGIINCSNYGSKVKAKKLAAVVRGWKQYHKYCTMSGVQTDLWFLSESARKSFNKEAKNDKYSTLSLIKKAFPTVSSRLGGHVKVREGKSPFDGDITYWSKRNSKMYDNATAIHLRKQNHTCAYCNLKFFSDEDVELHHIDGNHNNWKPKNLQVVHRSCHQYIHMSKRDSSSKNEAL